MPMDKFKRNARGIFFTGLVGTILGVATWAQAGMEPNPEHPDPKLEQKQETSGKWTAGLGLFTMAASAITYGLRGAFKKNDGPSGPS